MTPAKVLVVDDEEELLEIFSTWLERDGYDVLSAANGLEALEIAASEKVDALVSDIRMPIMDGPKLVRRLQAMNVAIPVIIFVSGFGDIDLREMHALGVEATIEKPMTRRALLDAVADSLKHRAELWLTPQPTSPQGFVHVDLSGADHAFNADHFELGRGGFCFRSNLTLAKGQMIDVTIPFADTPRCLKAHGEVRWYDWESGLAGVALRYLDPVCREWVVASILANEPHCFIPSGRRPAPPVDLSGIAAGAETAGVDVNFAGCEIHSKVRHETCRRFPDLPLRGDGSRSNFYGAPRPVHSGH